MPSSRKRRLPLVPEADATGRTSEIYQEIKSALGVPHVSLIFQAYAAHPELLDVMWKLLSPTIETRDFFVRADRLRAEAYTRMHNYFSIPDLCAQIRQVNFTIGAQHELSSVVDLFHYNNSLLLLIAAVQLQAFEDGPARHLSAPTGTDHPIFADKPIRVTEEAAPAPIRRIYEDMKRTLGISYIDADYQAFARWPDFLYVYWNALKPALSSPLYGESKHALRESAMVLAIELPTASELSAEHAQNFKVSNEDLNTGIHISEEFLDVLSGLLLNIAFAKIALEGGTRPKTGKREEVRDQVSALSQSEFAA